MDLTKKITVLLLLVTIGVSIKMILDRKINTYNNPQVAGQSSNWLYRRSIYIENDKPNLLFERDVKLVINTEELIISKKLQPTCNDIRFLDEDNQTPLQYKFENQGDKEQGCNSEETVIWVKIPTLKEEGKTIYFLYGNSSAIGFDTENY
jgi:hypothetical protein